MNLSEDALKCTIQNDIFYVFEADKNEKHQVRLLDKKGFIKVQRSDAKAVEVKAADWEAAVDAMWKDMLVYKAEMERTPDLYLCIEGKVLDYANTVSLEQLKIIMGTEFAGIYPDEKIILLGARSEV